MGRSEGTKERETDSTRDMNWEEAYEFKVEKKKEQNSLSMGHGVR